MSRNYEQLMSQLMHVILCELARSMPVSKIHFVIIVHILQYVITCDMTKAIMLHFVAYVAHSVALEMAAVLNAVN